MAAISVIIPTYNRSALVREACQSVLQQTFTDFEILIIDDGSTDNTAAVVNRIADDRVKYFYKKKGGQSMARNFGLQKSTGRYLAFLDSDDLWPADYLRTVVTELEANKDYGAAYGRVIVLYPDGSKKDTSPPDRCISGWLTKYFFHGMPCLMPSVILFRKSAWLNIFWDEAITRGTDYDVFLRISVKIPFLFVPEAFIIKRSLPNSLSNIQDPLGPLNGARSLERFYLHFQGDKYVSRKIAARKISHKYRKAAKISQSLANNRAAARFLKNAIQWCPWDIRLYFELARAAFSKSASCEKPDWETLEPLPENITCLTSAK